MMHLHGEQYGDGVPWAEQGKGSVFFLMNGELPVSATEMPPISQLLVGVKVILISEWNTRDPRS